MMTETPEKQAEIATTPWIREGNVMMVEAVVDKLNKVAEKLGVAPMLLEKLEKRHVPAVHILDVTPNDHLAHPAYDEWRIRLSGEPPVLPGKWKLMARIEHDDAIGALVHAVPGVDEDFDFSIYRSRGPICDHCGHQRRRKDTFVVQNMHGDVKQVGRTCVADFLGHADTKAVAQWLESLGRLLKVFSGSFNEDDEWGEYFGERAEPRWDLLRILEKTLGAIRVCGWVSRKAAGDGGRATADIVMALVMPSNRALTPEELEMRPTEEEKARAAQALEWVQTMDPGRSDYLLNLSQIAQADHIGAKHLGLACSIISAWMRAMEKAEELRKDREALVNEWVGKEKERLEFKVRVKATRWFQNDWGDKTLVRMITEAGHTLVWFATGDRTGEFEIGAQLRIKATVKGHDEYKDWKQTIVNRVAVLEEIDAETPATTD